MERIKSNQGNVETYIESHEQAKREFSEKVLGLDKKIDEFGKFQTERQLQDSKLALKTKDILDRVGKNWRLSQEQTNQAQEKLARLGKKKPEPPQVTSIEEVQSAKVGEKRAQTTYPRRKSSGKLGKSILPHSFGKKEKTNKGMIFKRRKLKKPGIFQKVKKKIGGGARKLKKKISSSFIGKTYRGVVKTVKFVVNVIRGVAKAVAKTIVAAWKATKFVAKTFYKAAKFTGKVVKAVGKAAISGVKKLANLVKKGPKAVVMAVLSINPGKMITKMGWKAVKFVGKSIWKGIKTLAFKALSFFGRLFGIMGKFVNKIGHWIGILSHGIVDKTYKFIVKPIASMLVSIFNFVSSVVMSPI